MKPKTSQELGFNKDKNEEPVDIVSKFDTPQYNYPFASKNNENFHLILENFKTSPCPQKTEHNRIKCPFYHSSKDYRRNASLCRYTSFKCPHSSEGKPCHQGDACSYCHNSVELNYHPNNYKRRFCIYFPDNLDKCKFGEYCSYAHSDQDLLGELLHNYRFDPDFFMFHYKTAFCPITHITHDRSLCVYAHNWQDYRRKPNKYFLQPEVCPDWNNSKVVIQYEEGCPRGFNCSFCHGWKEPEFHPFVYKTKKCESSKENCPRLNACPYYHTPDEQRYYAANQISNRRRQTLL